MGSYFAEIVEKVKKMSSEDKQELRFLLDKYLIEEQREAIYKSYKKSLKELREDTLKFSDDMDTLKDMIDKWWKFLLVLLSKKHLRK